MALMVTPSHYWRDLLRYVAELILLLCKKLAHLHKSAGTISVECFYCETAAGARDGGSVCRTEGGQTDG